MSQFPRFAFSSPCRQSISHTGFSYHLRVALTFSLAALVFFSPFGFKVSAQRAGVDAKLSASDGDFFILYQNADGDTVCRQATLREQRELRSINSQNLGLHPVTHVKREYDSFSHATNLQDGTNAVGQNLTIILRATTQLEGFPEAKAAFIRAAQTWETQIKSPITIYIDADFGPKNGTEDWDPDVLGATSSPSMTSPYQSVRTNLIAGASNSAETSLYNSLPATTLPTNTTGATTISVSTSAARALGLLPATARTSDAAAHIGFNSNFQYDFDPSDGIDFGKTDFEAVATHEIGHALGFTSRAGGTSSTAPAIWDVFRFRTGTTLSTFGTAQRIMTADGLQYYFSGGSQLGLSTGGPDGDARGGDGNQSSHWKQAALNNNVYIGIMDPRIPNGVRRTVTANDFKALNSFGYNLENNNAPPPPPPPPPAPGNNNFANAQTLANCTGSVDGTTVGANKETGEPSHDPAGNIGGASVWYQWQAPVSGSVTINTAGTRTNFDTILAVYTGSSLSSLRAVVKNDDVDPGVVTTSTVTFNATAGTVYKIAVDGWGGDAGNFVLNWTESNCTQATTVQLGAANYTFGEGAGRATVTVKRSDTSTAATVDYNTSDTSGATPCDAPSGGAASARCDYAISLGTLRFAIGESSKTITIPLVDDSLVDGTESFTLSLSNPSGASLGTNSSATITITDNDTAGALATNPIDQTPFFVRQHYIDFLAREPEAAGYQGWQDILNNCAPGNTACDRIEVSSAFYRSEEFQTRAYFIYRFYSTSFGRLPLYAEFMPDMAKVSGFLTASQLEANKVAFINEFMNRQEFKSRYDGLTDPADYVNALVTTAGVTLPNKQALIDDLTARRKTRAQVLRAIAESTEVYQKYYTEAFVVMQYFGYLRRDPDSRYLDWINTMNQFNGDYRIMINGFMNSAEYRHRFGP